MLGNDVVDLRDADTEERRIHPRFDARVFSDVERAMIEISPSPNRTRWRTWAAKEAAYKAARRLDSRVIFSPIRFQVSLDEQGGGRVEHAAVRLRLRFHEIAGGIHAVAFAQDVAEAAIRVAHRRDDDSDSSGAVRRLAREVAARQLAVDARELSVECRERIPDLVWRGDVVGRALSLSHHGGLVGCVWHSGSGFPRAAVSGARA